MDTSTRTQTLFLVLFIVFSHQIITAVGDGGQHRAQDNEEKPPLSKILRDTISLLKKSHQSSWDKVKAIVHEMQLQFFPPNLEGKEADGGGDQNMKEAAKKSMGMSKTTVEESAKSAAEVVGEAVEKTANKVKNTVSNKEDYSHDEL